MRTRTHSLARPRLILVLLVALLGSSLGAQAQGQFVDIVPGQLPPDILDSRELERLDRLLATRLLGLTEVIRQTLGRVPLDDNALFLHNLPSARLDALSGLPDGFAQAIRWRASAGGTSR